MIVGGVFTRFQHPGARLPLLTAGTIRDKAEWCQGRTMDAYALVYLLEGAGEYRDAQGARELVAGDVMVLFPDMQHFYGPHQPGNWAEAYLVFHSELFVALERDELLRRDRPRLSPGLSPQLLSTFDVLIREHSVGPARDPRRTSVALHELITDIVALDQARSGTASDKLALARARLEQDLSRELDLHDLSRELDLGYENFRKLFVRAFGVPPARYRLLRRIDRAKSLLVAGNITLSGVAAELGFCDEFHFSRQFKKLTGVSPGSYRKSMRGSAGPL